MTAHHAAQSDNGPGVGPEGWFGAEDATPDEPKTYLTFEMASQTFVVDVRSVREILDLQPISRLPNAPGDVLGVIDVRGEGIGVVALAERLGLSLGDAAGDGRIIVFEMGEGEERTPIGVIAERVLSVVEIADEDIERTPATLTSWDSAAVVGVTRLGGALAMVLELDVVFGITAGNRDPFDFR